MRAPPPLAQTLIIWLLACTVAVIAGPFGTIALPLELRLPYWLVLNGINTVKWATWMRTGYRLFGRERRVGAAISVTGIVVLNLPLPLEVLAVNRMVGNTTTPLSYWPIYLSAVALGLITIFGIFVLIWLRRRERVPAAAATPVATINVDVSPPEPVANGSLLLRAGVTDATLLLAVEAEDHYLRLHLADGRRPLVLYRLRDALTELSHLDGEQVHRGYWVAGRAVHGLERREGRKWALRLQGGLLVPVSATFMPLVRRRGWTELAST